jgi:hypothetical protein
MKDPKKFINSIYDILPEVMKDDTTTDIIRNEERWRNVAITKFNTKIETKYDRTK